MSRSYWWSIPIAFIYPAIQIVIFMVRFGHLPVELALQSLIFMPTGLISGLVLIALLRRCKSFIRKICTCLGYLLITPLAILGSLLGGLVLPPLLGATLYGTVPLIIGSALGYWVGGIIEKILLKKEQPA